MRVYRISKCDYINDLSGTGAARYPGRWHSKGTYILYTAASPSLAMLESIVHITSIVKLDLCMICLEIPEGCWKVHDSNDLPRNWKESPPPDALQQIGDAFVQANEYLALQLPSVVMPEENNFLLNPAHARFDEVKTTYIKNIQLDKRMFEK